MNSKKINVAIIAHFHKLMIILRDQFFLTRISIFDYYRSMSLHNDTKLVKIKIRMILSQNVNKHLFEQRSKHKLLCI